MRSTKRTAVLVATALALVLVLTTFVAWAQSADGPYFVVDPSVATNTTHVFNTIAAAIAALNAPNMGKQAWGATLVLLPGNYNVPGTITIITPYLKIVTRDGEDKARIIGTAGITINVLARGVSLQDLKIIGAGANTGIRIAAPDVAVDDVIVSGFTANGLSGTGNRLSIIGSSFSTNGTNGIRLNGCPNAVITNCDVRSNGVGVTIGTSNNVQISDCRISNNAGGGIAIANSSHVQVKDNKEIRANAGPAVALNGCGDSEISGNELIGNISGIQMANCVGCIVQENKSENSNGPAISMTNSTGNLITKNHLYGVENPRIASATILLAGNATTNTVSENVLTKNTWGIVLNNVGLIAPSGNTISANEISKPAQAGIYVRRSGGSNVIQTNSISDSVQFGLWIQNGTRDEFTDNTIQRSASDAIRITNQNGNVTNCLVTNSVIDESGGAGISVGSVPPTPPNPPANINWLTLSSNTISNGAADGISVNDANQVCTSLSLNFNKISGNDGNGVNIANTSGTSLWRNVIHDNEDVGLVIAGLNGSMSARQNTIYANQRGGVDFDSTQVLVLEENSLFFNLGYALNVTGANASSFAKNWWGSASGPAGVFNGTGNAVLGLANQQIIEPILTAPALTGSVDDAAYLVATADAQVSFINSFAAGRVVVDRTDTSGLKLVFTKVSVRNNAFVATMPFTAAALKSKAFTDLGSVLAASGLLVSGIQDGMVSVGFQYGSDVDTANGKPTLYVYQGGQWKLDDSGTWILEGGNWDTVSNCRLGETNQVLGDVPVESLTGEVKAIALVQEKPEAQ